MKHLVKVEECKQGSVHILYMLTFLRLDRPSCNVCVCLVTVCMCGIFYFSSGRLLAVKGFEKCDFELLHVKSQFDQCLLQLSLASGHSELLIDEFLCVSPWTDV